MIQCIIPKVFINSIKYTSCLTDMEIKAAEDYLFKKTYLELKHLKKINVRIYQKRERVS